MTNIEEDKKILDNLEAIKDWNPETQTIFELQQAFVIIHNLASKWKKTELFNVLEEYSRFYKSDSVLDHHNPENGYNVNDIQLMLASYNSYNRVIATDYQGDCLLDLGIDEWGNTLKFKYSIHSLQKVGEILEERSYREHMSRD